MLTGSNYSSFLSDYSSEKDIHVRIELGGLIYEESEIITDSVRITGDLFPEDTVGVGGTCSRDIEFSVFPKDDHKYSVAESVVGEQIIDEWYEKADGSISVYTPTADTIVQSGKTYYEETGEATARKMIAKVYLYTTPLSTPIDKGEYYVKFDSRNAIDGTYTYKGGDALSQMETAFIPDAASWVSDPFKIVETIASHFSILIDDRTKTYFDREVIQAKFPIGYFGDAEPPYTYRDVLSFIGVMLGGNWVITDEGKLNLVLLSADRTDIVYDLQTNMESLDVKRRSLPIGGIEVDLAQSDAVSGDELYREYIPYVKCGPNETTVKRDRLYFKKTETMFTEVNLEDYESPNPYREGWFEYAQAITEVTPQTDPRTYIVRLNPHALGWYEKVEEQGETYYTLTGDTSVLAIYDDESSVYGVAVLVPIDSVTGNRKRYYARTSDGYYFKWDSGTDYPQGEYKVDVTVDTLTQHMTLYQNVANLLMVDWNYIPGAPSTYVYPENYGEGRPNNLSHEYSVPGIYTVKILISGTVFDANPSSKWWATERPEGAIHFYSDASYTEIDINNYISGIYGDYAPIDISQYLTGTRYVAITDEPGYYIAQRNGSDISPATEGWLEKSDIDDKYKDSTDTVVEGYFYKFLAAGGDFVVDVTAQTLTQQLAFYQTTLGLLTVDWGDNTAVEVDTEHSFNGDHSASEFLHTYAKPGVYTIKIRLSGAYFEWFNSDTYKQGRYRVKVTENTLKQSLTFYQGADSANLVIIDWDYHAGSQSTITSGGFTAVNKPITAHHTYDEPGEYYVAILEDATVVAQHTDATWWVTARPTGAIPLVDHSNDSYWFTQTPAQAKFFSYKQYYHQTGTPVAINEYAPSYDTSVDPTLDPPKQYFIVANYERLNVGADEVKRGVIPYENQWYEFDEEASLGGNPVFKLTEDSAVVVYEQTYDYIPIDINTQYDDVNPSEKGWYEFDQYAGTYKPTEDTSAAIRYYYAWEYGKHVTYKIDLNKENYYTQRLEIHQSVPNLVMVNWGDPDTPEEDRIEMDNQHTWVENGENNEAATFSHVYANRGEYTLTLDINPDAIAANPGVYCWWEVISRPTDTRKYCDKTYYERSETTIQQYKYYYRKIDPEYQLIDPASDGYYSANPYTEGWYRRKYGDKILKAVCPWVTTEGLKQMFENIIKGFRYQAYEASNAFLPPTVELGDYIKLNGVISIFAHFDITLGLIYAMDISAPGESEDYSDSSGSSVSMTERTMSGKIVNALSAANDIEATEVNTSRRVILYLDSDTSDDNYFRVHNEMTEWVSGIPVYPADSNVPKTTQHRDYNGNLLYWDYSDGNSERERDIRKAFGIAAERSGGYPMTDTGVRVKMTTAQTCFPVIVYQYTELVKASLSFEKDGSEYLPVLSMGAGDGVGNNVGKISKPANGLKVLYDVPFHVADGYSVGDTIPSDTLYEYEDGEYVLTEDTTIQDGTVYWTRRFEKTGFVADKDGFLDITGLRRTDAMDFSNWDGLHYFEERIEGLSEAVRYNVTFDGQNRPIKITDADLHEIDITWGS